MIKNYKVRKEQCALNTNNMRNVPALEIGSTCGPYFSTQDETRRDIIHGLVVGWMFV